MKEFDKIIKNKIKDVDSAYPSDTWANIQKGLPKKKKRPYALLLLAFFTLMICSFAVVKTYFTGATKSFQKPELQKSDISTQPNTNLANIQGANSTFNTIKQNVASSSEKDNSIVSNSQNSTNTKNNHIAKNNTNFKNKTYKTIHKHNALSFVNASYNSNIINNEVNNNGEENTSSEIALPFVIANNHIASEQLQTNKSILLQESKDLSRSKYQQLNSLTLPSTGRVFGTDQSYLLELVQLSMKKNASLPCPTFVKKQNLSFIEFYFSNDYGIRSLSLKHAEQNAFLEKRNNTEFPFFSYSFGTRFGIGWESGIAFKSGLNYTQLNEKFIYTDPNSIQIKTITLLKYIYDNNFNVIDSVKTTEEVEIPGSNTIVNYNKYRFIDIPILFQYTIPGSKRLSYSITAGPFINISFTQGGKILSADNKNLIDISESKLYKDNIGLSLYTALAINYQLTKNTQIVFEPNVRFVPNSISQLQNPIDQKYLIASIAAGFRYKI